MSTELKIVELIETKGMTRVYRMSDGTIQNWIGGTASWRHNNPGNMKFEYADSADKTVKSKRTKTKALSDAKGRYEGAIALDQRGNAIFESIEKGNQARFKLLKKSHGDKKVRAMLDAYAIDDYTGKTNNDAYAKSIYALAEKRGLDIKDVLIKDMNQAQFTTLVDGMKKHEGFIVGKITYGNGTSVLVYAVDLLKNPYIGAKITISYQPATGSKITKSFTADEFGRIPAFDAPAGSILSFTINGKNIDKTFKLEGGKTKPFTLIDSTAQPIKAKTEVHDGAPKVKAKPKVDKPIDDHKASSGKVITFDIKVIDGDTSAVLPKTHFSLEYKGNKKSHQTDEQGIEKTVHASVGETIMVYVEGYHGHDQKVASFTVADGMGVQTVKIPVHTFDIILRTPEAPLAKYAFETHYRDKVKERATDASGKVKVKALIGQKILIKTKQGEHIFTFVVDATKQAFKCLITNGFPEPKSVTEKPNMAVRAPLPNARKTPAPEPAAKTPPPKAAKPKAKDVSPKQSVINDRTAKGNPVTQVVIPSPVGGVLSEMKRLVDQHIPYSQAGERGKLTAEGLAALDCSETVAVYLAKLGVMPSIRAISTGGMCTQTAFRNSIGSNNIDFVEGSLGNDFIPKRGDIFVWRTSAAGHTGIVYNYDAANDTVTILEAIGRVGSAEERFNDNNGGYKNAGCTRTAVYHRLGRALKGHSGWKGYFRPKNYTRTL